MTEEIVRYKACNTYSPKKQDQKYRLFNAFLNQEWVTANDIIFNLRINKYTSCISSLRKDGWIIPKKHVSGTLYKYRLAGRN